MIKYVKKKGRAPLWLKAPYISSFHRAISALEMSTDVSQVGVTLFPFFNLFFICSSF